MWSSNQQNLFLWTCTWGGRVLVASALLKVSSNASPLQRFLGESLPLRKVRNLERGYFRSFRKKVNRLRTLGWFSLNQNNARIPLGFWGRRMVTDHLTKKVRQHRRTTNISSLKTPWITTRQVVCVAGWWSLASSRVIWPKSLESMLFEISTARPSAPGTTDEDWREMHGSDSWKGT